MINCIRKYVKINVNIMLNECKDRVKIYVNFNYTSLIKLF